MAWLLSPSLYARSPHLRDSLFGEQHRDGGAQSRGQGKLYDAQRDEGKALSLSGWSRPSQREVFRTLVIAITCFSRAWRK